MKSKERTWSLKDSEDMIIITHIIDSFGSSPLSTYHLRLQLDHELDENLGPRPEGDDGRRKSSKLSRRWLRPTLAAVASLRGCVMAEFKS